MARDSIPASELVAAALERLDRARRSPGANLEVAVDLAREELTRALGTDEPPVMGAGGGPAPMPTPEECRAAHKAEYVRLFVEVGVDEVTAAQWHDDSWEEIKGDTPQEAFDSEVSYWDADE